MGRLRKTLPIDDYKQLYNFGICGESSEDLLKRFDVEAEAIKPDKIVFAVGINDSKLPSGSAVNKVSLEEFEQNLNKLLQKAQKHTDEITLVGLTKIDESWRSTSGSRFFNAEIKKYDSVIKKVADEHNYRFISVLDVINTSTDLADGIHPNTNGYEKIFKRIKSEMDF